MKKWTIVLLLFLLFVPLICQAAGVPGYVKERMGTLSGEVVNEAGEPFKGGGIVSFFITDKGVPPLFANMHRIPDMVGRMGPDGKFNVQLVPGTYYVGALVITDPNRGPGPPREGENFYFAKDGKGKLLELTLGVKEIKDAGKIVGALPETFPLTKNLVTIEGRLLVEDGQPFKGGVVMVKTDMNSSRPDFVSARTAEDGSFKLELPPDTPYYLLGRERSVGRPVPGSYLGTYGSRTAISAGGALPIGSVRPAQPAGGMPQVEGVDLGPGDDLPATVIGKAGETLKGVDIMMFRMPVPGEQREKLQGTLGFGDQVKQNADVEMQQTAPAPAEKK